MESKTEYPKVIESPAKPVAENVKPFERNVDAPRPAVYVKVPFFQKIPASPIEEREPQFGLWMEIVHSKVRRVVGSSPSSSAFLLST
jgi:hypothetical protein